MSQTGIEDPQEDPLAVHCSCVCRGSVLLGDLLGVNRSRERDLLFGVPVNSGTYRNSDTRYSDTRYP